MRPPINNPTSAPSVVEPTEDVAGGSHQRMVQPTDTELLNWLEQNPPENLQAVEWQLNHGKAKTVRESVEYHLLRGL